MPSNQPQKNHRNRYQGFGLALSGGGYRATLFHLGLLRRLNELNLLHRVDAISSVSGGSITNAYLAKTTAHWKKGRLSPEDWNKHIRDPLVRFTKINIRTLPILKSLVLPWKKSVAVTETEKLYQKYLTRQTLADLPGEVDFIFCASDILFSTLWRFRGGAGKTGNARAGYLKSGEWESIPVARAVAASSCFPPLFAPQFFPLTADQLRKPAAKDRHEDWANLVPHLRLTDGGVYDNLGLEPLWKNKRTLIVSNGGKPTLAQASYGTKTLSRLSAVLQHQVGQLRQRWFIDKIKSTAIPLHGCGVEIDSGSPTYSPAFARDILANMRTDLNSFNDLEAKVLENHAYALTDHQLKRKLLNDENHDPDLIPDADALKNPQLPYPELTDEKELRRLLRKSHKHLTFFPPRKL